MELRERKETLEIAAEEARGLLTERRRLLDSADTIATFAEEMSESLKTSELTETRAFVHSFVKEVQVKPGRAAILYSILTPDDSPIGGADAAEVALNGRVMNSVLHGSGRSVGSLPSPLTWGAVGGFGSVSHLNREDVTLSGPRKWRDSIRDNAEPIGEASVLHKKEHQLSQAASNLQTRTESPHRKKQRLRDMLGFG